MVYCLWRSYGISRWCFVPSAAISSIDFGDIAPGTKHSGSFQIVNSGWATSGLGKVFSSCGCITTSDASQEVRPGEQMTLEFNLKADERDGMMRKEIVLESRRNPKHQLVLTITANVSRSAPTTSKSIRAVGH